MSSPRRAQAASRKVEPQSDVIRGLALLKAVQGGYYMDHCFAFVHQGEPVSKARARFTRSGRAYTPEKTETAEMALSWSFKESMQNRPTYQSNVAVAAIFFRPNRQRIDGDNLMKLVLDAATKAGVWVDDCQVTTQAAVVELDEENPRTIIAIGPSRSSMDRTMFEMKTCPNCGKTFEANRFARGRQPTQKFCTAECARRGNGQGKLSAAICRNCGKEFTRNRAGHSVCTEDCRRSALSLRRKNPTCATCGGPVSRPDYVRCRACWRKGAPM